MRAYVCNAYTDCSQHADLPRSAGRQSSHYALQDITCMQIHALLAFQMSSTPVYGQSCAVGLNSRPVEGSTKTGLTNYAQKKNAAAFAQRQVKEGAQCILFRGASAPRLSIHLRPARLLWQEKRLGMLGWETGSNNNLNSQLQATWPHLAFSRQQQHPCMHQLVCPLVLQA